MQVKSVTVGKELLTNLGNYSNIKISHYMTIELMPGEEPNWEEIYDTINWNLTVEHNNTEAGWLKREDNKDAFKLTLKLPKRKEEHG